MDDMLTFYKGLGVDTDRCQLVLVDGVHDMKKPKREPCYGWLNKWFGREGEGSQEPQLDPETVEALRCTETGFVLRDLGGESGQTLNAKVAERFRPPRRGPEDAPSLEAQRADLKAAIAKRIGLKLPKDRRPPGSTACGSFDGEGFRAAKLLLESEQGIVLPSLLLRPKTEAPGLPLVLLVSELGKPTDSEQPSLALELARRGFPVLALDVRGSGETDPRARPFVSPVTQYDPLQFRFDTWAVEAAQLETTMLAMRTYDVVRGMDYLESRRQLAGRRLLLVGEGLGGIWALAAAAFDDRPAGAICVGAVPSYKLIVEAPYYRLRDYFWVAGALRDFDLPDLVAMIAPRPVTMVDPMNAMLQPLEPERRRRLLRWPRSVYRALHAPEGLRVVQTDDGSPGQTARHVAAAVHRINSRGP
jgi:pimeloyl-ACP methyl ester carboxylesterase